MPIETKKEFLRRQVQSGAEFINYEGRILFSNGAIIDSSGGLHDVPNVDHYSNDQRSALEHQRGVRELEFLRAKLQLEVERYDEQQAHIEVATEYQRGGFGGGASEEAFDFLSQFAKNVKRLSKEVKAMETKLKSRDPLWREYEVHQNRRAEERAEADAAIRRAKSFRIPNDVSRRER